MDIKQGADAPNFNAKTETGADISLDMFKGKQSVLLYFYPKDNTPGCTIEAKGFRDALGEFEKRGVAVIGCSGGTAQSHQKFIDKYDLNFPLLVDEDHAVATAYGAYAEKKMFGKTFMGVSRKTFLIDKDGKIAKAWQKVKAGGHAEEVLEAIDGM